MCIIGDINVVKRTGLAVDGDKLHSRVRQSADRRVDGVTQSVLLSKSVRLCEGT